MRLLLYEWCCSGGMQSETARDILQKAPREDFLREGRLMLETLACDADKNADLNITVMVDATLPATEVPNFSEHITVEKIASGKSHSSLLAMASEADLIILIAPETHSILLQTIIAVEQAGFGDRLVNCSSAFYPRCKRQAADMCDARRSWYSNTGWLHSTRWRKPSYWISTSCSPQSLVQVLDVMA